ncbi:hypothetical protein BPY_14290 [Bifidobacterium psychraerophilum]|uniref:hypothetical protein n=1 Tax=Bifidobacterium psychraerophilum TaxID=218140 RepID=UPI00310DBFCD
MPPTKGIPIDDLHVQSCKQNGELEEVVMANGTRVRLTTYEIEPLRETMRDVQVSVADYYAATAESGDLGGKVRAFLINAQRLNDHFQNKIRDKATYRELFKSSAQPGADVIDGIKYARNVIEHVLHIVRPKDDALVGGSLGFRVYPVWDDIPPAVHAELHPNTQKLKPAYDNKLLGQGVIKTMLDVLRFYAAIAPDVIHRGVRGEWTGFPLTAQPGMSSPLHPEEPLNTTEAWNWINNHLPNGDARIICYQLNIDSAKYLLGYTFTERLSFAPFVETVAQVAKDIGSGFPYFYGDITHNVECVTSQFPTAGAGTVLRSRSDIADWAILWEQSKPDVDRFRYGNSEYWERVARQEDTSLLPQYVAYEVRRSRRLNAFVAPRY